MSNPVRQCLPVALSTALILALFPALSHATHSWGTYHWARSSNSFTLKVGDNVSSSWDSYLTTAATDWSLSAVLDIAIDRGRVSNPKTCKPTSGRVEVCSDKYGNNGWLGLAQIWISGSHITQGAVKLNDTYFTTQKYNIPAWRRLVMCQEVGHTFGLDHQDEVFDNSNLGTCMDYTNDPSGTLADPDQLSNEHPNAHDYQQLVTIYSHLDSSTTVQAVLRSRMPPSTPDDDTEAPARLGTAQWGRLIRSTNHGRTELFETDLGRGRKVLTHIIWADPEE